MKKNKIRNVIIGGQGKGIGLIYTKVTPNEYNNILSLCRTYDKPINIVHETDAQIYIVCAKEILLLLNK